MPIGKTAADGVLVPNMQNGNNVNPVHGQPMDPTKSDYLQTDNTKRTVVEGGTYNSAATTG